MTNQEARLLECSFFCCCCFCDHGIRHNATRRNVMQSNYICLWLNSKPIQWLLRGNKMQTKAIKNMEHLEFLLLWSISSSFLFHSKSLPFFINKSLKKLKVWRLRASSCYPRCRADSSINWRIWIWTLCTSPRCSDETRQILFTSNQNDHHNAWLHSPSRHSIRCIARSRSAIEHLSLLALCLSLLRTIDAYKELRTFFVMRKRWMCNFLATRIESLGAVVRAYKLTIAVHHILWANKKKKKTIIKQQGKLVNPQNCWNWLQKPVWLTLLFCAAVAHPSRPAEFGHSQLPVYSLKCRPPVHLTSLALPFSQL